MPQAWCADSVARVSLTSEGSQGTYFGHFEAGGSIAVCFTLLYIRPTPTPGTGPSQGTGPSGYRVEKQRPRHLQSRVCFCSEGAACCYGEGHKSWCWWCAQLLCLRCGLERRYMSMYLFQISHHLLLTPFILPRTMQRHSSISLFRFCCRIYCA